MEDIWIVPEEAEVKKMVSILMESPLYLDLPLKDRLDLARDLAERYKVED